MSLRSWCVLVLEKKLCVIPITESVTFLRASVLSILECRLVALGRLDEFIIFTHVREIRRHIVNKVIN